MTVVSFPSVPRDDEVIFVCNCGCASYMLLGDGSAECRECGALADDGGWAIRKDGDRVHEGVVNFSDGGNDPTFSEMAAKRRVKDADWIVWGTEEGRVVSWCRKFVETKAQISWLRRQVKVGVDAILRDAPK